MLCVPGCVLIHSGCVYWAGPCRCCLSKAESCQGVTFIRERMPAGWWEVPSGLVQSHPWPFDWLTLLWKGFRCSDVAACALVLLRLPFFTQGNVSVFLRKTFTMGHPPPDQSPIGWDGSCLVRTTSQKVCPFPPQLVIRKSKRVRC